MIILDTNVISEFLRPHPDDSVTAWVNAQPPEQLFTTAITVQECFYGAELLPDSACKTDLVSRLERLYESVLDGQVLPFDDISARYTAALLAHSRSAGRAMHHADAQIAGIALQFGATLATRNTKDFEHARVALHDPWH